MISGLLPEAALPLSWVTRVEELDLSLQSPDSAEAIYLALRGQESPRSGEHLETVPRSGGPPLRRF